MCLNLVNGKKRASSCISEDNKKPTKEEIEKFLRIVDKTFPIPLSEKTNLSTYAEKLEKRATICTIKDRKGNILSMFAGYTENVINKMAYGSMLATVPESRGLGYGSKLVKKFLNTAREKELCAVHLYAVESNKSVLKMYETLGFERWHPKDESRPEDVHLIYRFK